MIQFLFYSLAAVIGIFSVASLSSDELRSNPYLLSPESGSASKEVVSEENAIASTSITEITTVTTNDEDEGVFYQVINVTDGDTITIHKDGISESVRLIGVDTPETVHPSKPVQCFGREASAKTKSWLEGARVRLEIEASQGERDKYGRLLGYVFRDDGFFVNLELIKQGYAHEYTYNLPYKYQTEFKKAETEARSGALGLWEEGVCEAIEAPVSKPSVVPTTSVSSGTARGPQCSTNLYNCGDFHTKAEAQSVFTACGGAMNDIHRLDSDGDGYACETLD